MTKTLTEQWREGTLPDGYYYVKGAFDDDIYISHLDYEIEEDKRLPVEEVLAPVPSYEEYKELVSKTDKLEKRLARTKSKEYIVKVDWFSPDPVGFLSEKQTQKMFGNWKKKKEVK